ncbi:hypothetical protein MRB53_022554 [Persea americana]|uniref:Uncharacterized protein n=1 Tax=Persea americana TaxID=3435 RepID=A0ACC2L6T4_PERAE|nr:hypothetical protein MRB53_022554 [Persea americana]
MFSAPPIQKRVIEVDRGGGRLPTLCQKSFTERVNNWLAKAHVLLPVRLALMDDWAIWMLFASEAEADAQNHTLRDLIWAVWVSCTRLGPTSPPRREENLPEFFAAAVGRHRRRSAHCAVACCLLLTDQFCCRIESNRGQFVSRKKVRFLIGLLEFGEVRPESLRVDDSDQRAIEEESSQASIWVGVPNCSETLSITFPAS